MEEVATVTDDLFDLLVAAVAPLGLELVDVELRASAVRVVVDAPGGVDLEAVSSATRVVSSLLDAHDPFPGRYTLEVSSPGLERPLRTQRHFAAAVGQQVSLRTVPGADGDRRVEGRLVAADAGGIVVEPLAGAGATVRVAYADIERARTVFAWGGAPKPSATRRKARPAGGEPAPARQAAQPGTALAVAADKEKVTSR